jgi:FMN-dependent oxidoreductase (nitrilotriacetate monooxygenase family)
MKLGVFFYPTGHHIAGWRHPDVPAAAAVDFAHRVRFVQKAERAKFDLFFLGDKLGITEWSPDLLSRLDEWSVRFEPITLLSALATVTERIGLVSTASTTYNEPYHVARKFASLDHLSGGRAGWNLVTSSTDGEAHNFSRDIHVAHAERYERAEEFADVVFGLWDSWDDEALLRDKESGVYFDVEALRILNHKGKHFSVRGPLNVPRTPQGRPVVVQAGSSEPGKELAARTADVIFTAQHTLAESQAFYADVKGRLAGYGRSPDDLKVMPGVSPVVGRSDAEARERLEQLDSSIHPRVGVALLQVSLGGADLSGFPLDGPLPDLPVTNASRSRRQLLIDLARRDNLSIRQLYQRVAGAIGHWQIVGTPERIVDELEHRFVNEGADGFNIMPPASTCFVDLVVPELQRRGLFRLDYEGRTLRENLGLRLPDIGFTRFPSLDFHEQELA